ncbi:MAG TPA: methyltransferase domain-containing protein [Methylocystis sp.]|nr:methyltransferase domain-containing protein [Methylocystis sp.]
MVLENVKHNLDYLTTLVNKSGLKQSEYLASHLKRFAVSLSLVPEAQRKNLTALDIDYVDVVAYALKDRLGYASVAGTLFSEEQKSYYIQMPQFKDEHWYRIFEMNLEKHTFDCKAHSFDLITCFEVVEHLDVDPMFFINELNRILAPGGTVVMTTPNSASSRNVWKILNGYRPHFYMQYERDRSPYRHNFEYDVHALKGLLEAGGFTVGEVHSEDVFEEPVAQALTILKNLSLPTVLRGDDLMIVAKKSGPPKDRYPAAIYA